MTRLRNWGDEGRKTTWSWWQMLHQPSHRLARENKTDWLCNLSETSIFAWLTLISPRYSFSNHYLSCHSQFHIGRVRARFSDFKSSDSPFLVPAFSIWTRQPKIKGHLFNVKEGIQKSERCTSETADPGRSSSTPRGFHFRFHICLVPSHLPYSLLGESHEDSRNDRQNKKDSCWNRKSTCLAPSVSAHGRGIGIGWS